MKNKATKMRFTFLSLFLLIISNLSIAQHPEFIWAEQVGSTGPDGDYGKSIAVDEEGFVYTVGTFRDSVKISIGSKTETLISNGNDDIFLTKQDATGDFIWAKSFGGSGKDGVNSIVVARNGEVYVAGKFYGTADFDPGSNKVEHTATPNSRGNPGVDFYISKFSSSGDLIWVKVGGNDGNDDGNGIALDPHSDDIYFTGSFGGGNLNLDFGQGVIILNNSGTTASFILKMKSSGSIVWAKVLGDRPSSGVGTTDIAVDLDGNVYTTGSFSNSPDFNPDPSVVFTMTAIAKSDAFVSKLDSLGNFVWAKSMGGDEVESGFSIAVDDKSMLYPKIRTLI